MNQDTLKKAVQANNEIHALKDTLDAIERNDRVHLGLCINGGECYRSLLGAYAMEAIKELEEQIPMLIKKRIDDLEKEIESL